MKKNLTAVLAATMVTGAFTVTASAAESAKVFVTISDGTLKLTQEEIIAKDLNNDGKINIDEALFAAHEEMYQGDDAGYESGDSEYGRSLVTLWGNDCGSYGYYVNNASAISLDDEVKDGDYINAYCYTDLTSWSDTYCFFDKYNINGSNFSLTLSAAAWDENYNPITVPVEGAVITINGEKTDFVTDAEGKVAVAIDEAGSYVISAVSETQTLVPPVCIAEISEAETGEVYTDTDETHTSNPATGLSLSLAGVATAAGALLISGKRK